MRQRGGLVKKPGAGIDLQDLKRFLIGERRHDARHGFGEHRLSRARRTEEENVVVINTIHRE